MGLQDLRLIGRVLGHVGSGGHTRAGKPVQSTVGHSGLLGAAEPECFYSVLEFSVERPPSQCVWGGLTSTALMGSQSQPSADIKAETLNPNPAMWPRAELLLLPRICKPEGSVLGELNIMRIAILSKG